MSSSFLPCFSTLSFCLFCFVFQKSYSSFTWVWSVKQVGALINRPIKLLEIHGRATHLDPFPTNSRVMRTMRVGSQAPRVTSSPVTHTHWLGSVPTVTEKVTSTPPAAMLCQVCVTPLFQTLWRPSPLVQKDGSCHNFWHQPIECSDGVNSFRTTLLRALLPMRQQLALSTTSTQQRWQPAW